MNSRYHALLQLVDYPTMVEHLAVGDRVIIAGKWRRVCAISDGTDNAVRLTDEGENVWTVWPWDLEAGKIPRIPAVLLDILSPAMTDPYR